MRKSGSGSVGVAVISVDSVELVECVERVRLSPELTPAAVTPPPGGSRQMPGREGCSRSRSRSARDLRPPRGKERRSDVRRPDESCVYSCVKPLMMPPRIGPTQYTCK